MAAGSGVVLRMWLRAPAAVLVPVAFVACAPPAPGGVIGTSTAPYGSAPAGGLDGGIEGQGARTSPLPPDFRTSMARITSARFLSRGHAGGRWDAEVYASQGAAPALGATGALAPVGSLFVEEHFERTDGGAGPIFIMEKRPPGFDTAHGDWRYVAIGARGDVVKDGVIESCAGCHGDAPTDHLFRIVPAAQ